MGATSPLLTVATFPTKSLGSLLVVDVCLDTVSGEGCFVGVVGLLFFGCPRRTRVYDEVELVPKCCPVT